MLAAALLLAAPAQPAEIRIAPEKPSLQAGDFPTFKVELRNVSKKPLQILDIGDGSESHWVNPHIGWSILQVGDRQTHPDDTPKALVARCGNMNSTAPEMFHTVAPGATSKFSFWPMDFDARKPGKYRIVFYYEVDPNDKPRVTTPPTPSPEGFIVGDFGGLPKALLPKYRALTPLKLKSNEVRFEIRSSGP